MSSLHSRSFSFFHIRVQDLSLCVHSGYLGTVILLCAQVGRLEGGGVEAAIVT